MFRPIALATALVLLQAVPSVAANEFDAPLRAIAESQLTVFGTDPVIVEAIRAQNAAHAGMSEADVLARDAQWRAETAAADQPMINQVLGLPGSTRLHELKMSMGGMVTEVFVTDALGMNVVQSDITSDYWQGDEAKWQMTFGKPAGTLHLGDVELDESTQTYQSQVSFPIFDPDSGEAIGAVTIGIDLSAL